MSGLLACKAGLAWLKLWARRTGPTSTPTRCLCRCAGAEWQGSLLNGQRVQLGACAAGLGPLKPLVRVGSAAGVLLDIPRDRLRSRPAGDAQPQAPLSRQLQRGLTGENTCVCVCVQAAFWSTASSHGAQLLMLVQAS